MVDIEKLKEICGDEALSETPSRYITTSEYRHARRLIADLLAEIDDYKRSAEVEAKLGDEARAELRHAREQLQSLIDQTTPLEPVPGDPKWSRRIQLDEVIAERDQLRAEVERRARNEIRLGDLYSTTEKHLIASGIENDRLREEVEALRAVVDLLSMLRGMINCTPENDELKSGAWISTKHPTIQRIDALLAAMAAKEGE